MVVDPEIQVSRFYVKGIFVNDMGFELMSAKEEQI